MKKTSLYSVIVSVCLLFVACKPSTLLTAGFESDAINSPPAKNLPGDPAGDEILFDAALDPQLKVQNSTIAGSKSLHFTNVPITNPAGHLRWLSFKGIDTDLTKTIWFTHTGQNTGASHDLLIDVSDGHGHIMARMRIKSDGVVGLATNLLDDYTNVIGNVGSGVHTIVFTTSPSSLKYNVTIIKSSGPAITAENKPMITEEALSFANPANPMISFQHSEESGSGHTYAIGSVLISKKKP
ncbi:MAG: hypothetical protein C0490_16895 [Marivirga sp.]|nr:hypothetical protein [Marivirga sp.]